MHAKILGWTSIGLLSISVVLIWLIRFKQTSLDPPATEQPVSIRGVIEDEPRPFYDSLSFHIDGLRITGKAQKRLTYGDYIQVEGVLHPDGTVKQGKVIVLEKNQGNSLIALLGNIRRSLLPIPQQFLPPREAALISGLVLGEKSKGDKEYIEALRKTGTLHIIVVSGANLTMVAGFFLQLKRYIGIRPAIAASILVVWFYALLTGGQAPVIRAAIMVSLAFSAKILGRQQWQLYSLLLAGTLMLLLKPMLYTEISFQLSFAATLGIILFAQRFYNYFANAKIVFGKRVKHLPFSLAENLSTTLAAQLLVIPLILYHFHEISLLSPLVNILVLPVVFYLTILGAILLFVGYFSHVLGTLIGLQILLPATYFSSVVLLFAKIPFVSTKLFGFDGFFVAIYYLYIFASLTLFTKMPRSKQEKPQFATILTTTIKR